MAPIRKPSKSLAGVTPLAVVLKPMKCKHGTCLYCPSLDVPQSYTPKSPAVMRAAMLDYDAFKQAKARLRAFKIMGHPTDKIELIVMGGTFTWYPKDYQYEFVKRCYDALNGTTARNLREAQAMNEKAKHRLVALCLETRPDACSEDDIKRMLELGCTRVELGVQTLDDRIYKLVKRGHTVKHVIKATQKLKDSGFKIGYHMMPGLPGSSFEKDLAMFRKLFNSEEFRPDQLKIYPCQVVSGAKLEEWYWQGKYRPYSLDETKHLLKEILKIVPRYCRVMRVMREIPPDFLVAGIKRIDLRREIEKELREENADIKEIRFREIGFVARELGEENIDKRLRLRVSSYRASRGKEFFLEIVNTDDILFALLRLRFPYKPFIDVLENAAIVRELHVYGKAVEIGKKGDGWQHKGFGKLLIAKAEAIAREHGYEKLAVISGVGVREYYRKLGYKLDQYYMVKHLSNKV